MTHRFLHYRNYNNNNSTNNKYQSNDQKNNSASSSNSNNNKWNSPKRSSSQSSSTSNNNYYSRNKSFNQSSGSSSNSGDQTTQQQNRKYNETNRFSNNNNQRSSYNNNNNNNFRREKEGEFKPKFKSTVIPFEQYKKQNSSMTTTTSEQKPTNSKYSSLSSSYGHGQQSFRKSSPSSSEREQQPFNNKKFNNTNKKNSFPPQQQQQQQEGKFRKERFNRQELYEGEDEIATLFNDIPTTNKGREASSSRGSSGSGGGYGGSRHDGNRTRFKSSIENQVDSYINNNNNNNIRREEKGVKSTNKKNPSYIPANEKVRNMLNQEKEDDHQDDFQDLTRVKKIDMKHVDKKDMKKKNQTRQAVKDPMSDELNWIDEDEYRSIYQKGIKKMRNDSISTGATSHVLSKSRNSPTKPTIPNTPSNVTFVMDDSKSLTRRDEDDEIEDDDDNVIFYGDEEEGYEDGEEEYDEEDLDYEEEEKEQTKRKDSKKVKKEQEEAPKIDILPDAMVGKYLKQIQKEPMSKNREFNSLPVVNGYVKEIFTCGLASKKSLKQAEYLQYFTSDEISKSDEEAKSRNAMANMLSGNKVIEAQLKRQQVARKTNKTSLVYNQAELRADMQVKDDVVNWVFKNYKMKYIGSIGLSKEDELLLLKEQQEEEQASLVVDKDESKLDENNKLENLSKEELNEILEREENLYEFYRRNYEEDEQEQEEEEKQEEEVKEEPETLVHKLYDISKMLEKCKGIPQVAFAGRSNVGKSSLINAITGRNNLKASEKPGQTKDLNFHRFGKHFCLVDMPGYGFAFTKDSSVTQKWLELIRKYFVQSSNDLKVVFLLIDSRLGLKRKDMDMIAFLEENSVPYQIIFTKCDLMYVDDLARMAFKTFKIDPLTKGMTLKNHIKDEETGDFRMIFVSSRSKTGVARLKEDIVLRHSHFDVQSWKKNVKKNVVLFV